MFLEYNGTDGNIHFAAATVTGAAAGITATTTTYTNATDFVVIVGAASHALALTGLSLVA